jgi:hypothetical protein
MDDEVRELHELSVSLHSLSRVQTSINWQKARANWLNDGDTNSKFFHASLSARGRRNSIQLINVDGVQVEGVHDIRTAVFNHFSSHFRTIGVERPGVEDLHFRRLSSGDSSNLVRPFYG